MSAPDCILVATDFSEEARRAASRGAQLANELAVKRAVLMHVLGAALPAEIAPRVMAGTERALGTLREALAAAHGVSLEPRVVAGAILERLGAAMEEGCLLVVGARGLHPLRDFALGTTAERLVRKTRHPMLVVRRSAAGPYRRVLVAVDFSPPSLAAARLAAALAPEASLHLVHAYEVEFESTLRFAGLGEETVQGYRNAARERARQEMERFIAELRLPAERITRLVAQGYAPSVLSAAERRIDAELVVLGKHGKSALEELLLGSVTLHALQRARCDVAVAGKP